MPQRVSTRSIPIKRFGKKTMCRNPVAALALLKKNHIDSDATGEILVGRAFITRKKGSGHQLVICQYDKGSFHRKYLTQVVTIRLHRSTFADMQKNGLVTPKPVGDAERNNEKRKTMWVISDKGWHVCESLIGAQFQNMIKVYSDQQRLKVDYWSLSMLGKGVQFSGINSLSNVFADTFTGLVSFSYTVGDTEVHIVNPF